MQSFQVYIPIQKGEPGKPYKITETMPSGETRTRYRLHGVASTTGLDRDSERVTRGCIEGMVGAIKAKKLPIFGNHQHDWENMLGYADNAEALNKEMEIDILTAYVETHPKVGQLVSDLEAGLPLGLSVGGKVVEKDSAYEPALKKNITVIKKIGLLETSVVGIGSNEDAFLSLPDQICKSLNSTSAKEASYLDNTKAAGQGVVLQQPVQTCPECGKPAELRQLSNGGTVYFCPFDAILFEVIAQEKKIIAAPISQPAKLPLENIEQQQQKPLGGSKKGLNSSLHTKKATGGTFMKKKKEGEEEEEDESSKQEGEEEEEETSEEKKKKKKTAKEVAEEKPDKDEEEKSYKTFVKFMTRFKKEATKKTEGVDEEPGEENADPENTIGGSGGAGTVANSKSAKNFETMKKAIKENVGAEGIEKGKPSEKKGSLEFKSFRDEQLKRK